MCVSARPFPCPCPVPARRWRPRSTRCPFWTAARSRRTRGPCGWPPRRTPPRAAPLSWCPSKLRKKRSCQDLHQLPLPGSLEPNKCPPRLGPCCCDHSQGCPPRREAQFALSANAKLGSSNVLNSRSVSSVIISAADALQPQRRLILPAPPTRSAQGVAAGPDVA